MKFNKHDRVKYIGDKAVDYIYPTYGAIGTVRKCVDDDTVEVVWDSVKNDNRYWTCNVKDLESEAFCAYCCKYSSLLYKRDDIQVKINGVILSVKHDNKIDDIMIRYCPVCGRVLKEAYLKNRHEEVKL